jgi:hypothetical protein
MNGPFEIELKIRLTDGERSAMSTYSLPVGIYPTKDAIEKAVAASLAETKKQLGKDWRLQNRHEFENEIISERTGGLTMEFATKDNWDVA